MAAAVVGVAVAADTRNEEGGVVAMGCVLSLVSGTVLVAARRGRVCSIVRRSIWTPPKATSVDHSSTSLVTRAWPGGERCCQGASQLELTYVSRAVKKATK